ncbi:TIR domain-containing protein [Arthrobacter sp. MI7-26]|uniref:TIR domain-containing protein n=1 Tax=Arthrobacter sp. MI7-26 TaxID=2993653 RepID=UPI002248F9D1|nr:TIR domain-containing protein [Arthrobacter sp. MI7-26]MCX2748615.1 TIR domain-containing protein [Arthrobacter sp. MI7-26]
MSSPAEFTTSNTARRVFISYAREDKNFLDDVRAGISALHHEAWLDSNLDGGQEWWDVILDQIRRCDAMILVVSSDLVDSEAASRERLYARQLGKRLIPLIVRKVSSDLLPPDIATLQFIDYTNPSPLTGAQLANALYTVPLGAPLPDPLPEPPAVPVSYLGNMRDVLRQSVLTADEQFSIAAKLSASLRRPREHDAALELLQKLEDRRDLYHLTSKEIDRIRQENATQLTAQGSLAMRPAPEHPRSGQEERVQNGAGQHGSGQQRAANEQSSTEADFTATGDLNVQAGHEGKRPEGETTLGPFPPSPYPNHTPRQQQTQQPAPPPNPAAGQPQFFQAVPRQGQAQQPQAQPHQGQQPWPQPPGQAAQHPAMPARHLVLSIVALVLSIALGAEIRVLLLFIPVGAVAFYFASQVSKRWRMGNPSAALAASKKALVWGWIGVAVSGLWFLALVASYASMYR